MLCDIQLEIVTEHRNKIDKKMVGLGNLTQILVGSSLYRSGSQVEASSGNPAIYLELSPLGSLASDFYLFHLFHALI